MKYRILFNGKDYIIQEKKFLFWRTLGYTVDILFIIKRFKTKKEVNKFVKERYGTIVKRVRKYHII